YSDAAKKAIDRAGIVEKRLHREFFIKVAYQLFGAMKRELEQAGGLIQDIAYGEQVSISCLLPVNVDIIPRLNGITAGTAELGKGEFCYI
ncbi:MAG TPA: DUF1949 domain-containing protein, partial [Syntrophaceticus sp.]|nr:DUF1949 domain-containing protein [Syntrophaceticus sp.]